MYLCSQCREPFTGDDVYLVGRLCLCFPCWRYLTQHYMECFGQHQVWEPPQELTVAGGQGIKQEVWEEQEADDRQFDLDDMSAECWYMEGKDELPSTSDHNILTLAEGTTDAV